DVYTGEARAAARREAEALRKELDLYHQSFMDLLRERGPSAASALDRQAYQQLVDEAAKQTQANEPFIARDLLHQAR
ncbi:MAG: hypothetical protein GWN58_19775, partial [Anaerolineae bacterium]|nr:hypothetical protein [Anaerolineae bacterium]